MTYCHHVMQMPSNVHLSVHARTCYAPGACHTKWNGSYLVFQTTAAGHANAQFGILSLKHRLGQQYSSDGHWRIQSLQLVISANRLFQSYVRLLNLFTYLILSHLFLLC